VQWNVVRREISLIWVRERPSESRVTVAGDVRGGIAQGRANLWFLPEGVDAHGELTGKGAYDCAAVFIDPRFLPESATSSLAKPIIGFSNDTLGHAFVELGRELAVGDDMLPMFTEGWAMQALAHVARAGRRQSSGRQAQRGSLAPWQVRRAEEILRDNLHDNVPLAEVAKACRLSPSYFSRAFKASTGQSPHGWIMALRVETARDLLQDSETPLAHVADMCGFADQSHLTRMFGRVFGRSPAAWRREHRV
jgi:AraC-like DNA-binding protein